MRPSQRLRRRLAAAAALVLAATAGAVEPQRPASPDSAAGRALLAQPLGEDPATAWSWLHAYGQVFPEDHPGYRQLRRGVVDLYLRQGAGEPFAADTPLAALREAGAAMPPLQQDREAQARWARTLERGLVPLRAAPGPVPDEIESLAERLEPLAPGLWLGRDAQGRVRQLFWAQRVSVRGAVPLAPQALQARFAGPGGALAFDCPAERGQPRAVRPGDTWRLLCRARGDVDERAPALRALADSLARDGVAAAAWSSDALTGEGALEAMVQALTAQVPDRTAMYATAHRACESRGRCALEARSAAAESRRGGGRSATGASQPRAPADPTAVPAPSPRQMAKGAAMAVAAFIAFCLVARTFGQRVAAGLMLVLLLPLAWRFGSGFGAASVLLAGGALVVALLATGAFLLGYWLYDALVFSRFAPGSAAGAGRPRRRASA